MPDTYFSITQICDSLNLEESQVRRAFKELKEFFENCSKRGESNKILFDSNAVAIFKRIKELSDQEPSFSEALRTVQKEIPNNELPKKEDRSESVEKELITQLGNAHSKLEDAHREAHRASLEAQEARNELRMVQESLKALPAGGDTQKLKEVVHIFMDLEKWTKPKWGKGKKVEELRERLRDILV